MPERRKRLLFVCSQNRLRSPTAEQVFSEWAGVETKSAGLDKDAAIPLSPGLIAWADIILVMEQAHRKKLRKRFRAHLAGKPVIVMGVPDEYVWFCCISQRAAFPVSYGFDKFGTENPPD